MQWHGPNGLRKIANKVRFMSQIFMEELTPLGVVLPMIKTTILIQFQLKFKNQDSHQPIIFFLNSTNMVSILEKLIIITFLFLLMKLPLYTI